MLIALYEVRNNRSVGHVGGDVTPNHMDAVIVLHTIKWIRAELIRIFHSITIEEATTVVEELIEKEMPQIWQINRNKRVLKLGLTMKEKTLLLLYSENGPVSEGELFLWVEHSNLSAFRRDVLVKGHKDKMWEFDKNTHIVELSSSGIDFVERNLL